MFRVTELVLGTLTLPQQLVSLAHALLNETLAVVQRLDAVGLYGVHLGQESGQSLRQQPGGRSLQLSEVPSEGIARLTRAAAYLKDRVGRFEMNSLNSHQYVFIFSRKTSAHCSSYTRYF